MTEPTNNSDEKAQDSTVKEPKNTIRGFINFIDYSTNHQDFVNNGPTKAIEEIVEDKTCLKESIPITTLYDFLQFTKEKGYVVFLYSFIYFIALEIMNLHVRGCYHGGINLHNIGIYYCQQTDSFIPSLLLFYEYYIYSRKIKQKKVNKEEIPKYQEKDIKSFFEIIDEISDYQITIPHDIKQTNDITQIVFYLYNLFRKPDFLNDKEKSFFQKKIDYKTLKMPISTIFNFGNFLDQNNENFHIFNHFLPNNNEEKPSST